METKICLDEGEVYIKRYKVRKSGRNGRTLETSIPRLTFEREARRRGLSVEKALEDLEAVWRFNDFDGLYLNFERKEP